MTRLFATGDVHGEMDIGRLSHKRWEIGSGLTREDYVIVLGDFGLVFHPTETPSESWWLNWLSNKPWTTLVVDGNHDNHVRLAELPQEEMFGGIVGKVADNICHLKRGYVYEIAGRKVLTFGGAESIDKLHRTEGISWWREEIPSYAEMSRCLDSMEKCEYKVDYIVAHTCPSTLAHIIVNEIGGVKNEDPTCGMLEHIVSSCEYKGFYCGHWHLNKDLGKFHFLYENIVELD